MSVATFDTCAAAKALREAGFDEAQAEAAGAMVRDAVTEGVATRADLKAETAALRVDFYRALWIQAGVVVAAAVALIKLLP